MNYGHLILCWRFRVLGDFWVKCIFQGDLGEMVGRNRNIVRNRVQRLRCSVVWWHPTTESDFRYDRGKIRPPELGREWGSVWLDLRVKWVKLRFSIPLPSTHHGPKIPSPKGFHYLVPLISDPPPFLTSTRIESGLAFMGPTHISFHYQDTSLLDTHPGRVMIYLFDYCLFFLLTFL